MIGIQCPVQCLTNREAKQTRDKSLHMMLNKVAYLVADLFGLAINLMVAQKVVAYTHGGLLPDSMYSRKKREMLSHSPSEYGTLLDVASPGVS